MIRMNKRSQVTVFVILGVVLVLGFLLFSNFRKESSDIEIENFKQSSETRPSDFDGFYYEIQSAARDFLISDLEKISRNGGILDLKSMQNDPNYQNFLLSRGGFEAVRSFYYEPDCNLKLFLPALSENYGFSHSANEADGIYINSQIESHFNEAFIDYLSPVLQNIVSQGYSFKIKSNPSSRVIFKNDSVILQFKMIAEVSYEGETFDMKNFHVELNYPYIDLYDAYVDVVNSTINSKKIEFQANSLTSVFLPPKSGTTNEYSITTKQEAIDSTKGFLSIFNLLAVEGQYRRNNQFSLNEDPDEQMVNGVTANFLNNFVVDLNDDYPYVFDFNYFRSIPLNFDLNDGQFYSLPQPLNLGNFMDSGGISSLVSNALRLFVFENEYSFDIPLFLSIKDINTQLFSGLSFNTYISPRVNKNRACEEGININIEEEDNNGVDFPIGEMNRLDNTIVDDSTFVFDFNYDSDRRIDSELSALFDCFDVFTYSFSVNPRVDSSVNLPYCPSGGKVTFVDDFFSFDPVNLNVFESMGEVVKTVNVHTPVEVLINLSNVNKKSYSKLFNFNDMFYSMARDLNESLDVENICLYNGAPFYNESFDDFDDVFYELSNNYLSMPTQTADDAFETLFADLGLSGRISNLNFWLYNCSEEFNFTKMSYLLSNYSEDYSDYLLERLSELEEDEYDSSLDLEYFKNYSLDYFESELDDFEVSRNRFLKIDISLLKYGVEMHDSIIPDVYVNIDDESISLRERLCDSGIDFGEESRKITIWPSAYICGLDTFDFELHDENNIDSGFYNFTKLAKEEELPVSEDVLVTMIIHPKNFLPGPSLTSVVEFDFSPSDTYKAKLVNLSEGEYDLTLITTYDGESVTIPSYCEKEKGFGMKLIDFFTPGDQDDCLARIESFDLSTFVLGSNILNLDLDSNMLSDGVFEIPNIITKMPRTFPQVKSVSRRIDAVAGKYENSIEHDYLSWAGD